MDRRPGSQVMDHRDPESADTRRFARLVRPEAVRKLVLSRLLGTIGTALLGLVLLGYGASYLAGRAVRWVRHQEPYWIPFDDITLVPPPPAWFRGGSTAFLEHVRAAALVKAERVPILEGDLERLRLAFQKSPWVRSVTVRSAYPRKLVVRLEYRQPVATAGEWLLDDQGTILPPEAVDRAALGGLLRVEYLGRPHDPRPGLAWQMFDEATKWARDDPRAAAAAQLAAFLRSPEAPRAEGLPPAVVAILVNEKNLYLQFQPAARVLWGPFSGQQPPDEPGPKEKWKLLRDWFRQHPEGVGAGTYLALIHGAVVVRHDPGGPLSRSSGGSAPTMSR